MLSKDIYVNELSVILKRRGRIMNEVNYRHNYIMTVVYIMLGCSVRSVGSPLITTERSVILSALVLSITEQIT